MGTNYYAVKVKPCLYGREIHLGKSSGGWKFLFKETDEIHSYPQFLKWLENNVDTGEYVLFNEYNKQITKQEIIKLIERKQSDNSAGEENFKYCKNIDGHRFSNNEFC